MLILVEAGIKSDTVRDETNNAFLTKVAQSASSRITKTSWLKSRLFFCDCERKISWWFWLKSSPPRWSEKRWQLREYLVDILLHRNRPPWKSVNLSPPMFYFQLFSRIFCCFYYQADIHLEHALGRRKLLVNSFQTPKSYPKPWKISWNR